MLTNTKKPIIFLKNYLKSTLEPYNIHESDNANIFLKEKLLVLSNESNLNKLSYIVCT